MKLSPSVIPAQAGIHTADFILDTRFRGYDKSTSVSLRNLEVSNDDMEVIGIEL
jgi:hypothetical protein